MLIFLPLPIKEIFKSGKDFPWPKPQACPRCNGHRLWGHGFAWAYFDGWPQGIWLRLYRCPECKAVHRLKPEGYFPRFGVTKNQIRQSLAGRILTGLWPPTTSRPSRLRSWLKNLRRQVLAYLGQSYAHRLLDGFDRLVSMGVVPVSRAI